MPKEIERKFLVTADGWRKDAVASECKQNYIPTTNNIAVRVRIIDGKGFLTLKGIAQGISRSEYEYEIPVDDAREILDELCSASPIEKTRHQVPHENHTWVVDEFHGLNQGLILAEIELTHPQQQVELPEWVGLEVSADYHYYNAYLAKVPFTKWPNDCK